MKLFLAVLSFTVIFAGCSLPGSWRMPSRTILTLNKFGSYKIKVVKYSFVDDFGAGLLICFSNSNDNEIVYSFKTKNCLRYETLYRTYPDYPDKEIRYFKNGKWVRSEKYTAITKDKFYMPDFHLSKEDSLVLFKVMPILDSVLPSVYYNQIMDTIVFPSITGYTKDTSSAYYPIWPRSWFPK